jgi:hypothetical protein
MPWLLYYYNHVIGQVRKNTKILYSWKLLDAWDFVSHIAIVK